jgi:hypothetical protein
MYDRPLGIHIFQTNPHIAITNDHHAVSSSNA